MIKVSNIVEVYEVDGSETSPGEKPTMLVLSHWNSADRVVLVVDGKKYTVLSKDINAAVSNAGMTARY